MTRVSKCCIKLHRKALLSYLGEHSGGQHGELLVGATVRNKKYSIQLSGILMERKDEQRRLMCNLRDELHDVAGGGLASLADHALVAVQHRHACVQQTSESA